MSSAVISRTDMNRANFDAFQTSAMEPSFSISVASLFPEFLHGDRNNKFDASQLFHSASQQVPSFKTAGDAAAAAHSCASAASNSMNQGNDGNGCDYHIFFEPSRVFQPNNTPTTPPSSAIAPCLAPSAHPTTHAPTPITASSVGSNEPPAQDFVVDEFDEMLSQLPLFVDETEIPATAQPPSIALSSPTAVPVAVAAAKVEVDSKIAALQDITKKQATTKPSATDDKAMKVAGAKRSRKYQTGQWDHRFNELLQFQTQHGNMFVPHSYPSNQKLAQWVKRQRYQHKLKYSGHHSTLSDEREGVLNKAGFIWDSHAASWQEQFRLLEQFSMTFGHCNVPTRYKGSTALNVWCKHQRKQYKLYANGKLSTLNAERLECLNSIGFNWSPRSKIMTCK